MPFGAAWDLAVYRQRAHEAWPKIQITDVDSTGFPDTPLLGCELTLRRPCSSLGCGRTR